MTKVTKRNKGFTLVELMISVGIFAFMTAFLLAKYGTFNQGILLTNLAYDVALTLRNAQSYGLNVKSQPGQGGSSFSGEYNSPYGVHFDKSAGSNANMIFFADIDVTGAAVKGNKVYNSNDVNISTYSIKRGSTIGDLCVGTASNDCSTHPTVLDITFRRPDPNAVITINSVFPVVTTYQYAEITLKSSDGGLRKVVVRSTGQISISK